MINRESNILPSKIIEGKDINYTAGFKRRLYASSNLAEHVIAEDLSDKVFNNVPLSQAAQDYMQKFLVEGVSGNIKEVAKQENLNLERLLSERLEFEAIYAQKKPPEKIVHIIGSPRSGTTHLFNLLAHQGVFSYFTTISHHTWSYYNFISNKGKKFIDEADPSIFELDNMYLRYSFLPIILPAESQEIFNKAIPTQSFGGKFIYNIFAPKSDDINIELLRSVIEKHIAFFNKPFFLSKDTFNSLRIDHLTQLFPEKTYLIHIFRDGYDVARSLNEYKFQFPNLDNHEVLEGKALWLHFIKKILEDSNNYSKIYHLSYERLIKDTESVLKELFDWLNIPISHIRSISTRRQIRDLVLSDDIEINQMNKLLKSLDDNILSS